MASDWQTPPSWWKRAWRFLTIPASFVQTLFSFLCGKLTNGWRYSTLILRRRWFRRSQPVRPDANRVATDTGRTTAETNGGKRRESLFAGATATGVVALLMILGWHAFTLFANSETVNEEIAQNTGDTDGERNKQSPLKKSPVFVTNSKQQAVVNGESPEVRKNPFGSGVGRFRPSPTKPINAGVAADQKAEPGYLGGTRKLATKSPFEDPEPSLPLHAAAKKKPISRTNIEPAAGDRQPGVGKSKIARGSTPKSEAILGLEVVRASASIPPKPDERFLVTSATVPPAAETATNQVAEHNLSPDDAGWHPLQIDERNSIVRTRQGRTSIGPSNSQPVLVTSTANAKWSVVSSRLKLAIILPRRIVAGERVPIRIRLTNVGAVAAQGVTLNIDLPRALTYHVGQRLSHTVGTLKPGQTHEARLTPRAVRTGEATVSASVTDGRAVVAAKNTRSIVAGPVRSQRQ